MKVVIIGAAAGGASLATRLRRLREKIQITLIEQQKEISYAACALPYFVGGKVLDEESLFAASASLLDRRYRIRVKTSTRAVAIDRQEKCVYVKNILGQSEKVYYDKLVIATGSEASLPDFAVNQKGVFVLSKALDAVNLKAYILKHQVKDAVVVGAGFIGLEIIENLVRQGIAVTLLEKDLRVLASLDREMSVYIKHELEANGVEVKLNTAIDDIAETKEGLEVKTSDGSAIKTSLVVMALGVRPLSSLAKECGIEVDDKGFIIVDGHLATSDPDIFALGDAVVLKRTSSGLYPHTALASPAQKQSRVLAEYLAKNEDPATKVYQGALGTSIVKIFNLTAGSAGFNLSSFADHSDVCEVTVHAPSHVSWYPNSSSLHLKLIFNRKNGCILGAQAAGADGVDKALEVISALMLKQGVVEDLVDFESAYAPPYSAPRSPVNVAGAAAANVIAGLTLSVSADNLDSFDKDSTVFVDIRTEAEFKKGSAPYFVNLPLESLRVAAGMNELDNSKTYVIMCQSGLRGHIASCILKGLGFEKVYNVSGGYLSWSAHQEAQQLLRA